MGYKALSDAGLRPERDLHLRFSGFPADALIYLLRERAVQAAIVPVCLLEKMADEGLVNKADFTAVIEGPAAIPCLTSTPLYPDWSFAALPAVSDALADRVTRALLNAPDNAVFHWGAPASTRQVEALLSEVQQHPQQRRLWLEVKNWLIQHRLIMGGIGLALLLLTLNYIWVMLLVRRRGRQLERNAIRLREQELALQTARQMSVLGEMTSGFAHELNQPLSYHPPLCAGLYDPFAETGSAASLTARAGPHRSTGSARGGNAAQSAPLGQPGARGARTSGELGTYQRSSGY